ncbi:hypothetical protein GCM10010240_66680 [Streptomyces griseoviridis]|nr:hypothetical protein GCM10010240_66680 [Streptomyces griseoviridis]
MFDSGTGLMERLVPSRRGLVRIGGCAGSGLRRPLNRPVRDPAGEVRLVLTSPVSSQDDAIPPLPPLAEPAAAQFTEDVIPATGTPAARPTTAGS